jgi:putative nucleotidyltransferase with HDIG domain
MFDSSILIKQFDRGEEVYLSFQYASREIDQDLTALLVKILSRIDKIYLYDTLESVFRELVQNAVKANMKRVWFKSQGLDINNASDYRAGMQKFREVAYHPEFMRESLMGSQYRIVVRIRKQGGRVVFDLINNAGVLPGELERIQFRMTKARQCKNFAEAYENMYDATEGAGLGIILTIMLLRNAGFDMGALSIVPENGNLKASVVIPEEMKGTEITTSIKKKILRDVRSLPTFPKSVLELQAMCGDPETTIEAISDRLSLDPSLTADVLRLSNSAGFITGKRISRIDEAVMIIGLKNLNAILAASATRKILDSRYHKFEEVWEHCNRTAYYARCIAQEKGHSKLVDSAFIAGLLHDIGVIVLLSVDPGLLNRISVIVKNRKIRTAAMLEEITIGISHPTIGALVAEQWNFPDDLVEAIRYHHAPLSPGIRNRDLVMIIYLSNHLCSFESRDSDLLFFESEILEKFGISTREEFDGFYRKLRDRYNSHDQFLKKSAT